MAKYKTEVEAPPVPHMFFEVGDVVETPSGKVFRHYGQGKWAQENYVSFETSPGGGIASITAGAYPLWLQGASLLDRVPLPRMRPILTPRDVNLADAVIPAGAAISIESAPDEMYGECIRIDLPAGLTTTTGRIVLPIRQRVGGGYPRALPRSELRMNVADWSKITTFNFVLGESVTTAMRGKLWALRGSTNSSRFGVTGTHREAAWDAKWRTLQLSMWQRQPDTGTPVAVWDIDNPEYEVVSVTLQIATVDACSVRINRVASPEWAAAGVITQGDGGHRGFYEHIMQPFMSRGWPGCVSRGGAGEIDGARMSGAEAREAARYGWIVIRHLSHWLPSATDVDAPATESFENIATTDAQMREFVQRWTRYYMAEGYPDGGFAWASCLRNQHPSALADGAGILRQLGVRGCRGLMSDAQFGINPADSQTNTTGLSTTADPIVPGWSPRWGRFNRMYIDGPATFANTPAARDKFFGERLELALRRAIVGNELTWWYTHRIQQFSGAEPAVDQSGVNFAREYVAFMDEQVRAGKVVPLNPMQADLLTYDRPGDVYMDWSGAWRSRTTGKVVL